MSTDPRAFDQTKPIVLARYGTLGGHELHAGHPLTVAEEPSNPGEVTADTAVRLWTSGKAVYADVARPTPIERPAQAAARGAVVDDLGGGWYMIRADWLPEAVKVQGTEATSQRLGEIIEQGCSHYHGVMDGTVVLDAAATPEQAAAPVEGGDAPGNAAPIPTTRTRRGGTSPAPDAEA